MQFALIGFIVKSENMFTLRTFVGETGLPYKKHLSKTPYELPCGQIIKSASVSNLFGHQT